MRLDKYLADMGKGTRREVRSLIQKGDVTVNGDLVTDPGYHVTDNDNVCLGGEIIAYRKYTYIMMNKPPGVVCSTSDNRDKTVIDLIKETMQGQVPRNLAPAGRLDKDTVGLLLITNDGALAHDLLSPAKHVDKTYYVVVSGELGESDVSAFKAGIKLKDFTCKSASLEIISGNPLKEALGEPDSDPAKTSGINFAKSSASNAEIAVPSPSTVTSCARVTISEGKYHQIKRMFASLGHEVLYLKRLSMGALTLDESLSPGEFRMLSESELKSLTK